MPTHATPLTYCPLFIGQVPAGFPSPADDYIERRLNLQEYLVSHPAATFYLKAGTTYPTAGIKKGDLLVVDRSLTPSKGRIAVIIDEGNFKIAIIPQQSSQFEVWGVVKFIIHSTLEDSHVRPH